MMVVDPCYNEQLDQHHNDWIIKLLIHNMLKAGIPSHDKSFEDKNGNKISLDIDPVDVRKCSALLKQRLKDEGLMVQNKLRCQVL